MLLFLRVGIRNWLGRSCYGGRSSYIVSPLLIDLIRTKILDILATISSCALLEYPVLDTESLVNTSLRLHGVLFVESMDLRAIGCAASASDLVSTLGMLVTSAGIRVSYFGGSQLARRLACKFTACPDAFTQTFDNIIGSILPPLALGIVLIDHNSTILETVHVGRIHVIALFLKLLGMSHRCLSNENATLVQVRRRKMDSQVVVEELVRRPHVLLVLVNTMELFIVCAYLRIIQRDGVYFVVLKAKQLVIG